MNCPICGCSRITSLLRRESIPVMQNVVYASQELGRNAPAAPFTLAECQDCGFGFNSQFDDALVNYGVDYDNDVPSPTFQRYYASLASMLVAKTGLRDGTVYEVGCGKGTFLEALVAAEPSLRAVGIDPSCTPRKEPRLELRRARFAASEFEPNARLVLLRHVLEHISEPLAFLRALREAVPESAHLYVEVPDVSWIYQAGAFWDFCYEHCNYFTPASLRLALTLAGFNVSEQGTGFGDQYQWAICSGGAPEKPAPMPPGPEGTRYAEQEQRAFAKYRQLAQQSRCVTWGMATKGVIFNVLVPGLLGGIDINPKKQGKFAAVSGLQIHSPDWLRTVSKVDAVVVMNPAYEKEIRTQLAGLGVDARVVPV